MHQEGYIRNILVKDKSNDNDANDDDDDNEDNDEKNSKQILIFFYLIFKTKLLGGRAKLKSLKMFQNLIYPIQPPFSNRLKD